MKTSVEKAADGYSYDEALVDLEDMRRQRDEALAESARLRQALTDVCSPMQMFLRGIPPERLRYVDSGTMVRLCDSVSFIQEIARKSLEAR